MADGNWTAAAAPAEEGPVAPAWAVWAFAGPVGGLGALLAAWLAGSAWRHGRCSQGRAQLLLLAQLAVADAAALLAVAPAELLVLAARGAWPLSEAWCAAFVGGEALLGAAAAYLVTCVCAHALLGPAADNSVGALPAAAAWLLAASLAAPLAWQARAVAPRPGLLACSLQPPQELAQLLVGVVRVALPALLLLACSLAAGVRLFSLRRGRQRQGAGEDDAEGESAATAARLRLALVLAMAQLALGLARPALAAARALLATPAALAPAAAFSAPPLAAGPQPLATLALAMLHHTLPALRPLLCCAASQHVRDALTCGCRAKARRVCRPLQS
ncbi:uncharacterized protein LOC126266692 [Schistocerca gregaria]|uniref:uncharacterized protein LOC126266692 n=1 Tax=Schistocerca gregaria TaxID=7010 RepID=UPI00211F2B0F|nr:uncharacterized protein LOC126266692 [Schistocerca gregaria]XP_049827085.1 uncharacterized protein LOC126266692 [Schistocerca gregaria]